MANRNPFDDLYRELEQYEREIETFRQESGVEPGTADETAARKIVERDGMKSLAADTVVKVDASVNVRVSEDEMKGFADFSPPVGLGEGLTVDSVLEALEERRIVYGIDREALRGAVEMCNSKRMRLTNIIVALGDSPTPEVPEHLELRDLRPVGTVDESAEGEGSVDFREVSPFVIVKKGDVLAKMSVSQPGEEGTTVRGEIIPFTVLPVDTLSPGENTVAEGRTVRAAVDGRFHRNDESFWVSEFLEIPGDVDYGTGNIDFPGDVLIRGEVKDRFSVVSGGTVYCKKTLDASEVETWGDLIVSYGIIGRRESKVLVGGGVSAKYIENCYLEAGESVRVKTGIINSVVHTRDRVELGKRGAVIGGKIHCQNGLTAHQLGSASQVGTSIICGTDLLIQQKLLWIKEMNQKLAEKLEQVRSRRSEGPDPAGEELEKKIRAKMDELGESAMGMMDKLHRNEEAVVRITGTVHPGVYVEICHVPYAVSKPLNKVEFRLDKESGRVIPQSLSARS
jgi:hypothetical protein